MKRVFLLLLSGVMFAASPQILSAQIHFTATLDGTQQIAEVSTQATGTGSFELSENFSELRYFVSYQGMSAVGVVAYFHSGKPGVNGSVIKSLTSPSTASGTFDGVWRSDDSEPLTQAFAESLLTGRVYIDLHDSKNAAGEIRGQLTLATSLHFEANYEGIQESPPVSATGGGTGIFVLNQTRTQIDYWVSYRGLSGALTSGGQIHTGAIETNGPVVRTIALAGDPSSATLKGSWKTTDLQPLTDALVDSLIAGTMYSNLHTAAHDGGEIRGQLILKGGIGFVASLDSPQDNPTTLTNASGTGSFVLNEAHNQLTYTLTFVGLSGGVLNGGQIHVGLVGQTGPIVKTISLTTDASEGTISGTWATTDIKEELTPALVYSLLTGKLYADFLAAADSGGQIRGQLNLTTGLGFTSQLSAKQDVPPTVRSNGTGTASVVLSPDRQSISYSLTFLDLSANISPSGGHFHVGPEGTNGGLVKTIVPPNAFGAGSVNGVWRMLDGGAEPLTPDIVDALVVRNIYINLHTGAYIGGEIRGQVFYSFDVPITAVQTAWTSPEEFSLEQNYPNPFNPSTMISYYLPSNGFVSLKVFDMLGREVQTLVHEQENMGIHSVKFNGSFLSSGVYFYRLRAGGFTQTKKLVLVR